MLGSAVLHAVWNALAKSVNDQLIGFTALQLAAGAPALIAAFLLPTPAARAFPYLASSLAIHIAYQVFLLNSYRVGDYNQVYPIARGTAPLVVTILAVPLADELLRPFQVAGVLAVTGGLVSLAHLRAWSAAGRPPTLAFAFGTGLLIATYSVVDGLGVREAGNAMAYASFLMAAEALPVPVYTVLRERDRLRSGWSATWPRAGLAGMLSFGAYAIVLWAQTRGPLGAVSALRETGVLVAGIIGAVALRERFGSRRVVAAALVAAGVALINVG